MTMTLPRHLEEAAARLKEASWKIDQAREKPLTLESLKEWLGALTDYSIAATEIHEFNNESIHEKLHEVAGRVGLKRLK
jgi:hypothetical protein